MYPNKIQENVGRKVSYKIVAINASSSFIMENKFLLNTLPIIMYYKVYVTSKGVRM